MADDRWLRATVRSRWQDATAGGGPHTACAWRHNYQWLLRVARPATRVVLTLSLPSDAAATGLHAPALALLRGNATPADHLRRKLSLAEGDLVAHAEPQLERRVSLEVVLEPSEAPYVLLPYLHMAGAESPFLLTVLCDAADEAGGEPAFTLEPVRKATDWCTTRVQQPWAAAAAAPHDMPAFLSNLQVRLSVTERAHCFVFVETIGVMTDMRAVQGMQAAPQYPAIGFVLAAEEAGHPPGQQLTQLPASALNMEAQPLDGVWYECYLEADTTHVLIPYLGDGQAVPPQLQLAVSVYTDVPHALGQGGQPAPVPAVVEASVEPAWTCETCAAAFPRRECPFGVVHDKMSRVETIMDNRLAFLDQVIAATGPR